MFLFLFYVDIYLKNIFPKSKDNKSYFTLVLVNIFLLFCRFIKKKVLLFDPVIHFIVFASFLKN